MKTLKTYNAQINKLVRTHEEYVLFTTTIYHQMFLWESIPESVRMDIVTVRDGSS